MRSSLLSKWSAAAALLLLLALASCSGAGGRGGEVRVFAASSLADAFAEMAQEFQNSNPEAKVLLNLAASSALRLQLTEGAKADIFASADERNMAQAAAAGVIDGEPAVLATNRLAIVTRAGDSKVNRLEDLANPGVKLVLASPQTPIGAYTAAALDRMAADPRYGRELVARLRARVVSEALNARHAVSAVELGEADAAIAYETDARSTRPPLRAIPLPDDPAVRPRYTIALVKGAPAPGAARRFLDFALSPAGASILRRHGFGVP